MLPEVPPLPGRAVHGFAIQTLATFPSAMYNSYAVIHADLVLFTCNLIPLDENVIKRLCFN